MRLSRDFCPTTDLGKIMRFDIMTLFPEMVGNILGESIIGRAQKSGAVEINLYNIRDYSED